MIVSVIGTILPPMIILSVISFFYAAFATNPYVAIVLKGMQAGVAAVILDVVFDLGHKVVKEKKILSYIIFFAAFVSTFVFGLNVIFIILGAAFIGIIKTIVTLVKGVKKNDIS